MNIHVYNDYLQDYKGQKLAEQIFQGIILVSAVSKTGSTFTLTAITTLSFLLCLMSAFPAGDRLHIWL